MSNSPSKEKLLAMIRATAQDLYENAERITGIDNYTSSVTITVKLDLDSPPKLNCKKTTANLKVYEAQQDQMTLAGEL